MPVFYYKARDCLGETHRGTISAGSRKEALSGLWARDFIVLDIKLKEGGPAQFFSKIGNAERRVNSRDMMIFCRLLAALLSAGMPVIKSLQVIQENSENMQLKRALELVIQELKQGKTLHDACYRRSAVFPPLFVHMMKAGEEGGVLPQVIEKLAVHFEKDYDLKEKIKSAAAYPLVISTISVFVILFLIIKVLPGFKSTFSGMGVELPVFTRLLIHSGEIMRLYGKVILPVLLILFYFSACYFRTESGKGVMDSFKMKIPVFGTMYKKMLAARFASNMGVLLSSGTGLLTSLELTAFITGSGIFSRALFLAAQAARRGQSITGPLEECGLFSLPVVELIRTGEETGTLQEMMAKAADFLESEVKYVVERVNTLIEPALIVFLAFVVGGIALSILLPMFTVFQQVL